MVIFEQIEKQAMIVFLQFRDVLPLRVIVHL